MGDSLDEEIGGEDKDLLVEIVMKVIEDMGRGRNDFWRGNLWRGNF